jgi:tetratricopeptide (TPR) repeat protein
MRKNLTVLLVLGLLAGCTGNRRDDAADLGLDNPRNGGEIMNPPDFALPGVPLKNEMLAADTEAKKAEAPAAQPAAPAVQETPAVLPGEAKPAAVLAEPAGDLKFHMDAAARYFARKQYRSAAAEYGAAVPFLPAGDARAVYLLERQGASRLKTGKNLKAEEFFLAAIGKAKELNTAGDDLANSYLGLGYCQEKAGKVTEAIGSYEKAMELTGSKTVKARLAGTISDLKKAP